MGWGRIRWVDDVSSHLLPGDVLPVVDGDAGEDQPHAGVQRVQEGPDEAAEHPLHQVEGELHQFDDRGQHPDVEDGDEGEDDGPQEGAGDGHDGSQEAVDPQLAAGEEDEGQAPHPLEALRGVRLGEHVVEAKLERKG